MSGAIKFTKRIEPYLNSGVKILNTGSADVKFLIKNVFKKKDYTYVLRLDGVNFVNTSFRNLIEFSKSRNWKFRKWIFILLRLLVGIKISRFILNLILNRNTIFLSFLIKRKVFQSVLSLEMFLKIIPIRRDFQYSIIFNGVDVSQFENSEFKKFETPLIICMSANPYRPHKRLADGFLLHKKLLLIYPYIKFRVFGSVTDHISKSIEGFSTENVEFFSSLSEIEYLQKMSECHIFLSLALFDPCPNVVCEALAMGMPVITPKQSGAAELLYFDDKWIVDEAREFDYFDFQDSSMVKISPDLVDIYFSRLVFIIENYSVESSKARKYAKRNDIKLLAQKYNAII